MHGDELPTKPQILIDTILIPKRTRLPSRQQAIKRTKSTRHRNPTQKSQKKPAHAPKPTPARKRQERQEQALCRCGQAAIQGQTRCAECAAKHREWHRQNSENRRRAKGIKPRPRIGAALIEQIQKETADQKTRGASQTPKRVRSEEYKKKNQQYRAQVRAERKSLGLCVQCAEPSPAGQTRCPDCVLKHRYGADWTAQQSEGKTHCRTIEATEEHRGPTIESPTWPNLPPPFTTIADPSPEKVRLSDATATGTIR